MKIIKIEITRLRGNDAKIYAASRKQVDFICSLMLRRGMVDEFQRHFKIGHKVVCNHITRQSASKLIDALKRGKDFVFVGYTPIPSELPNPIIKYLYKPKVPLSDVPRITMEEQRALEQKYTEEV